MVCEDDVAQWNERYGIHGQVVFSYDDHGFVVVSVNNAWASARLALQGAQLLHWAPVGHQPVIWLSDKASYVLGKSVRGGAPICWPWFGPHGARTELPAHGFARTALWNPQEAVSLPDGSTRLTFQLPPQLMPTELWPYDSSLTMEITVGVSLEVVLVTENRENRPITVGQALHTYFRVGDVRRVRILGLEGCSYIDKVLQGERQLQVGQVDFVQETDRIYLGSTREIVIDDPVMQRRIRLAKTGSASTVVWNPWTEKAAKMGDFGPDGYLRMVCVENANAADDQLVLAAQASHHLAVRYSVEPWAP